LGVATLCVNQVPGRLFRDRAMLLLIGYSTDQMVSGFCYRGYEDKQKPMHKNVLADAVEKLTAEEVAYILNETVKGLAQPGVFKASQGISPWIAVIWKRPSCIGARARRK
jgi:hypothetical protein